MSSITEDLLIDDPGFFSIAKIDETIARSKRIVQESLAITGNSSFNPKVFQTVPSPPSSLSNISLSISPQKNQFSNSSQNNHLKTLISESKTLLKELAAEEQIRIKELLELEAQLKSYQHPSQANIEESLKVKKEKIEELTQQIKKHPIYQENAKIKEQIKEFQEINTEARILSEILYEKKNKEDIEERFKYLYELHQKNSKQLVDDVQKIREKIKFRQAENQKTIRFLSNKLEEKILDNRLLLDHAKSTPKRNSAREFKPEAFPNKSLKDERFRRYSNPDLESEFFEYNKRIRELEAQVKKYKKKYENLKKTLQKNNRCSSIEMKTQKKALNQSKKTIKKKPTTKTAEKTLSSKCKTISPLILPN